MLSFRSALMAALGAAGLLTASPSAATTTTPAEAVPGGGGRLLLEGGWAVPLGDLDDNIDATTRSVGARPGFELGMRWRIHLTPSWSLGPSLHFLGYGDATGLGADGEQSLAPSSLRYGVELLASSARAGARPFVGLEPCVVHNRLEGPGKDHLTPMTATGNGLGLSARAGLRLGDNEISVVWHLNRFGSYAFFPEFGAQDFSWDTLVLRMGWLLP